MHRKSRFFLAVALIGAMLSLSSPPGSASFVGDNGPIAFGRSGKRPGIRVMRRDGSHIRRLTRKSDGFPTWSPDGRSIAFGRSFPGTATQQILVMNADGSGKRVVSSDPASACGLQSPSWSYDGLFLVYADDCFDADPRVAQLRVVTADGSAEVALTDYSALNHVAGQPWSPNLEESLQLVYTSDADGPDQEVYVVNADGSGRLRLTDDEDDQIAAQWSPAGTLIAFTTQRILANGDPKGFLEVISPTGGDRVVIAESRFALSHPLWSPDGSKILFTRHTRFGRPTAYVIAPDGAGEVEVGVDLHSAEAAWAPNSRSILFTHEGDIVRYRLGDGSTTRLTATPAFDSRPDQRAR